MLALHSGSSGKSLRHELHLAGRFLVPLRLERLVHVERLPAWRALIVIEFDDHDRRRAVDRNHRAGRFAQIFLELIPARSGGSGALTSAAAALGSGRGGGAAGFTREERERGGGAGDEQHGGDEHGGRGHESLEVAPEPRGQSRQRELGGHAGYRENHRDAEVGQHAEHTDSFQDEERRVAEIERERQRRNGQREEIAGDVIVVRHARRPRADEQEERQAEPERAEQRDRHTGERTVAAEIRARAVEGGVDVAGRGEVGRPQQVDVHVRGVRRDGEPENRGGNQRGARAGGHRPSIVTRRLGRGKRATAGARRGDQRRVRPADTAERCPAPNVRGGVDGVNAARSAVRTAV